MTPEEIESVRRVYARQMVGVGGCAENARLERAFAAVPRERFLGAGPWMTVSFGGRMTALPDTDPIYAYQDALFALSPSRGVNNGSPSLHARMLNALAPPEGGRALHLGAGTGYYTALLSELVGPSGRVLAVEIDPVLAARARDALSGRANVEVLVPEPDWRPEGEAEAIYVNFGVAALAASWIEALAPEGRLLFWLGAPGKPVAPGGPRFARRGGAFLVERRGERYAASEICPASFIVGEGFPVDPEAARRLDEAFRAGGAEFVRSLIWRRPADPGRCWFAAPDWALSYDPV